jgi:predicted DCC family thiol-disulfide oxidoreductase YuxK
MALYPLTVFFDGACPICAREISLMRRLDRHGRLALCDFSAPKYDAASTGLAVADLSGVIHARWADGTVITGVDVFRAMWEAVGLRFLAKLSRLSFLDLLAVKAYAWFTRNRLWLTGRANDCMGNTCNPNRNKMALSDNLKGD